MKIRKSITQGLNEVGGQVSQGLNVGGAVPASEPASTGFVLIQEPARHPSRRFPHMQTERLRRLAEAGLGETQRFVRRISQTEEEGTRPAPHVLSPEDVTRQLGVPLDLEQKIHAIVRESIPPSDGSKIVDVKRFGSARTRLLDFMRRQKVTLDSDLRAEIMRRALHYWRANFRVDYGRTPEMRMGKALVIPKQRFVLMKGPKVEAPGASPTGRVSMHPMHVDASSGKVGHKYIARKPDGHGGWLYKYPGDTEFRPGAGIEEGHTQAPEGAHLGVHESGFRPTHERHADGGHTFHFGEDVSAHIPANADREHHRKEHAKHGAAYKKAMAEGNEEKAKGHLRAYQMHAEAHNRALSAERKAAKTGMAPPGHGLPPDVGSQVEGKPQKQPPGAGGPATMPGAPGGSPGQRPPTQGGMAAGGAPMTPGGAGEPPQGFAARTPPGADVGQYRQHLQAASDAMSNLAATHAHVADLDARIKTVKADRSLHPRMKKQLAAQLQAEKAQAELDRFQHEDAHDAAMEQLKSIHSALRKEKLKHHPIVKMIDGLLKLMQSFASKMGHGPNPKGEEGASPNERQRVVDFYSARSDAAGEAKAGAGGEEFKPRERTLSLRAPTDTGGAKPVGENPAASPATLAQKREAPKTAASDSTWDADLASAKAKRDETERAASQAGDTWRNRQIAQGKDTQGMLREQLRAPTETSEAKTAAPKRPTAAGTVAPRKRAAKSATEADLIDLRKALALAHEGLRETALTDKRIVFTPPTERRVRLEW